MVFKNFSPLMLPQAQFALMGQQPQRQYMLQWLPKYRDIFRPKHTQNVYRRWDAAVKTQNYNMCFMDPLYFDHDKRHINGGMQTVSTALLIY